MLDATTDAILERYAAGFEQLQQAHRWEDSTILRIAAIAVAMVDPDGDGIRRLEEAAAVLKESSGWSDMAGGSARFVLAAMIVRQGLDAATVAEAVKQTRIAMKEHRLGGQHAEVAAFLLVLTAGGRPADPATLERTRAIMDAWKKDHPWLTGGDDLPMAALHAARGGEPEAVATRVERTYQALVEQRRGRGNQLQLTSHLLAVAPFDGPEAARRFQVVVEALERAGLRVRSSRFDEAALMAITPGDPDDLARRVLAVRDRIAGLGGGGLAAIFSGGSKELAFSMAVGVVLSRRARDDAAASADAATLALAQSALEAQQVALITTMAVVTTVT